LTKCELHDDIYVKSWRKNSYLDFKWIFWNTTKAEVEVVMLICDTNGGSDHVFSGCHSLMKVYMC
jgi:hypothetical protein